MKDHQTSTALRRCLLLTNCRLFTALSIVIAMTVIGTSFAAAGDLPPAALAPTLPPEDGQAFGDSVNIGPNDGLLYVWNGAKVFRQNGPNDDAFTAIGNVGDGSADAGLIGFSFDGTQLLIGNGLGGKLGGTHSGNLFSIATSGGDSSTVVGNIPFHDNALGTPFGATKFFVNQGDASFTGSSVSVLDTATSDNAALISDIPGPSGGMTIHDGRLYVGIGSGDHQGELRSFDLTALQTAYNAHGTVDWSTGALFNSLNNNSAFGLFFDSRGLLFAGGPSGVTVFDSAGHSVTYDNGNYTSVYYDSIHDRVYVSGFGDEQGFYPASLFQVPEPSTGVLAALAVPAWAFVARWRRRTTRGRFAA